MFDSLKAFLQAATHSSVISVNSDHMVGCFGNVGVINSELISSPRDSIRKAREAHLIDKGKTLEPLGLNKRDEL